MRVPASWMVLTLVSATAGAQHPQHAESHRKNDDATVHHRFEAAAEWVERFESPDRDAWQLPGRVVRALVDRDDLSIADIGSATGYFPVRFARAVPHGRVIGADVEPDMVGYLNDRARQERIPNLESILAAPDDPHLPSAVDLVFICDTYHHLDGRIAYFSRLRDRLTPGARVAIVDFRPESRRGPEHKLAPDLVKQEMAAAGYALASEHDFLPDQYFLVFTVEG